MPVIQHWTNIATKTSDARIAEPQMLALKLCSRGLPFAHPFGIFGFVGSLAGFCRYFGNGFGHDGFVHHSVFWTVFATKAKRDAPGDQGRRYLYRT